MKPCPHVGYHCFHTTSTRSMPYPAFVFSCCCCGHVESYYGKQDNLNDTNREEDKITNKECADGIDFHEDKRVIERTRRLEEMAYEITTYSVIPDTGRHSPYGGSE